MPAASSSPRPGRPHAFLSYGWQDNNPLVLRLKADLTSDGWEVWHDKDRISGGDAFTAEIEEGIRWCDVMIAVTVRRFLQKRSTFSRRPRSTFED